MWISNTCTENITMFSSVSYLSHRLASGLSHNKTLRHSNRCRHLLLRGRQQGELKWDNKNKLIPASLTNAFMREFSEQYTPVTTQEPLNGEWSDLSEVYHPVRLALGDQVVGGDEVDQVEEAVEQHTLQAFRQVFIQHVTVGQVH